jgi:hypothetical protein
MTANHYDLNINGEAGTLVGVTLVVAIFEWIRK